MSEENVEAIWEVYERFGEGDFRASAACSTPTSSWLLDPVRALPPMWGAGPR
jgi:hypothetical protein